jgi:hypothetical protein
MTHSAPIPNTTGDKLDETRGAEGVEDTGDYMNEDDSDDSVAQLSQGGLASVEEPSMAAEGSVGDASGGAGAGAGTGAGTGAGAGSGVAGDVRPTSSGVGGAAGAGVAAEDGAATGAGAGTGTGGPATGVTGSADAASSQIKSFLASGLLSFDAQAFRVTKEEEMLMGIFDPCTCALGRCPAF